MNYKTFDSETKAKNINLIIKQKLVQIRMSNYFQKESKRFPLNEINNKQNENSIQM